MHWLIVSRKCTVSWFPGKVHSYSHEPAFMSEGSTHVSCQMFLRLTRFYVPNIWTLSDAKLLKIWGSVTSPHTSRPELMITKPQVIEKVTGNFSKIYQEKPISSDVFFHLRPKKKFAATHQHDWIVCSLRLKTLSNPGKVQLMTHTGYLLFTHMLVVFTPLQSLKFRHPRDVNIIIRFPLLGRGESMESCLRLTFSVWSAPDCIRNTQTWASREWRRPLLFWPRKVFLRVQVDQWETRLWLTRHSEEEKNKWPQWDSKVWQGWWKWITVWGAREQQFRRFLPHIGKHQHPLKANTALKWSFFLFKIQFGFEWASGTYGLNKKSDLRKTQTHVAPVLYKGLWKNHKCNFALK